MSKRDENNLLCGIRHTLGRAYSLIVYIIYYITFTAVSNHHAFMKLQMYWFAFVHNAMHGYRENEEVLHLTLLSRPYDMKSYGIHSVYVTTVWQKKRMRAHGNFEYQSKQCCQTD